jgi:alpha-D-xyloside xylohydrolase
MPAPAQAPFSLESNEGEVLFSSGKKRLRVVFVTEAIARITLTEDKPFKSTPSLIVTSQDRFTGYALVENGDYTLITPALKLVINRDTGAIGYFDAEGNRLLGEPERGGKHLTAKKVTRNVFNRDAQIATKESIDGARAIATDFQAVPDGDAFEAKLEFTFAPDEALFGLGSHEEGYGNLRGKYRELYQQNMKIALPYFISTRHYGLLVDCCSLMTFHDDALGSYLWADVVDELDYYFIHGKTFDAITRGYHALTGRPPMLPKWVFGFAQSKERYVTAKDVVDIVQEHRRRRIPLDVIVLDWKSWPDGPCFGQKSFDPVRFPDPAAFTRELHEMGARLMISIWPIMTNGGSNQKELLAGGLMLGNQSTYDAFNPEARAVYWDQARRGLFAHGIDAWWCDCTEPFEADWAGAVKPEPHQRLLINTEASKKYLDHRLINAYSLLHSQGIYEGQRRATTEKRVVNLTRSAYAGQHRYGTIAWNGDVCATWETLRRCIPEGLNFCAAGEPYWTVDIGGFFIKSDPTLWFWRGDYDEGCRGLTDMNALGPDPNDTGCPDLGFHELYTRWLQYGAFLPMFRSHGTDAAREIWRFGDEGNPFYESIAKAIRLRYRLLPYIYSLAARATFESSALLRAVALDYPADPATHDLTDQFLFGPALLVCPVTTPMYFGRHSIPITGVAKTRNVYLPAGNEWLDFWSGARQGGGRTMTADAPLDIVPLFARAGSIVPLGPPLQYSSENPPDPIELRIYTGADGAFTLYEDEGDGYRYEQGVFSTIRFTWNDHAQTLRIGAREGAFPGMLNERTFRVAVVSAGNAIGEAPASQATEIRYTGAEVSVRPAIPTS